MSIDQSTNSLLYNVVASLQNSISLVFFVFSFPCTFQYCSWTSVPFSVQKNCFRLIARTEYSRCCSLSYVSESAFRTCDFFSCGAFQQINQSTTRHNFVTYNATRYLPAWIPALSRAATANLPDSCPLNNGLCCWLSFSPGSARYFLCFGTHHRCRASGSEASPPCSHRSFSWSLWRAAGIRSPHHCIFVCSRDKAWRVHC